MTRLFVDAMGGDHAPQAPVEGSLLALKRNPNLSISLGGPLSVIEPLIKGADDVRDRLTLVDAPELISNHEAPAMAIRQKRGSAIVKGMLAVRVGEADGFVSAGSTGAVLLGGMLRLGRVRGIERPALAPLIPSNNGQFLLIDCGANVDCQPEYLYQFGLMGDAYMRLVMGLDKPRIGLANVGDEAEKGNALTKASFPLLQDGPFHFVGNIEARYFTDDRTDVLVCDGFDGNLILKYTEGLAATLLHFIKRELMADTRSKLGALLAKPAFRRVKQLLNQDEVGGAPMLGLQGAVVKAHGSSSGYAFASAIRQAVRMAEANVAQAIADQLNTKQ